MSDTTYASRGGQKLRHALDEFHVDVTGLACADLGCSTGGFTDCLLQAGAAKVFAVDTAYGELAWKLRKDPRVVVMERTNALHAPPPEDRVDLVVVDLGWTPQKAVIPVALKWLNIRSSGVSGIVPPTSALRGRCSSDTGENAVSSAPTCSEQQVGGTADGISGPPLIITLIKPHYEVKYSPFAAEAEGLRGVLSDDLAERVMRWVVESMPGMGVIVAGVTRSPLRGGSKGDGNLEWLAAAFPAPLVR